MERQKKNINKELPRNESMLNAIAYYFSFLSSNNKRSSRQHIFFGIKSQRRRKEGEADEIRANVEISPWCQILKFVLWDVRKSPSGSGRNQPRNEAFQSNFLAVPSRKIALQSSNDKRTFASFSFQLVSGWMSFLPIFFRCLEAKDFFLREKFLSNVTLNSKALTTTNEKSFRKFFVPSTSMNLNVWIRHRIKFFFSLRYFLSSTWRSDSQPDFTDSTITWYFLRISLSRHGT